MSRANGEWCTSDSQCSSGRCTDYQCRAEIATCTTLIASCASSTVCNWDSECVSGYCRQFVGQANACRRHDTDGGRSNGEWCNADGQ